MISETGIHLPSMPGSDFDDPFGTATGSGVIFGATGGVMEAALRTVIELVCGSGSRTCTSTRTSRPCAASRASATSRSRSSRSSGPGYARPPVRGLELARRRDAESGRVPWTANARKVLEDIKAGGPSASATSSSSWPAPAAASGGGQPIPTNPESELRAPAPSTPRTRRTWSASPTRTRGAAGVRRVPDRRTLRFREPRLLHTHYTARGKYIG